MANDVAIETGADATIATDEAGVRHYQIVKLAVGTEDSEVRIGHAEDAAHTSGDGGLMLLAVRKDTAAALAGTDGDYIPLIVDASGRLYVETELPAAATLPAGGAANQAAPQVNALAAGISGANVFPFSAIQWGGADGFAGSTSIALVGNALQYLWNGSTIDQARGNVDATVLATAARTATTNTADQTSHNARGCLLLLDVTANPGGVETLTVSIESKLGGDYRAITAFAAVAVATNATYVYILYPGIVETSAVGNVEVQGLVLPRTWRAVVTHSSTGSWTYSLESCLIV